MFKPVLTLCPVFLAMNDCVRTRGKCHDFSGTGCIIINKGIIEKYIAGKNKKLGVHNKTVLELHKL